MNSKERVIRSIKHQEVDKVPGYYLATSQINKRLARELGIKSSNLGYLQLGYHEILDKLGCDVQFVWPQFVKVPGEDRRSFQCGGVHAQMHGGDIIIEKLPLEDAETVDDILNYKHWPSPDYYDYEMPDFICRESRKRAIAAYDMNILFLYAMGMRGTENIMVDMAVKPDMAHAVFSKISEFNIERTRRFLTVNQGMIDIVGIGDDVATQQGLFFSLTMWREYIKPHLKKIVDLCYQFNVIPYFHGCGGFRDLFPDFIEIGIQCVGRLQTEARGNNFKGLKDKSGREMCLWGGIDGQHILVEGTVEEVREHVKSIIKIGSVGSGFVAGPTHSFTDDVSIENVLAVYDVLKEQNNNRKE